MFGLFLVVASFGIILPLLGIVVYSILSHIFPWAKDALREFLGY